MEITSDVELIGINDCVAVCQLSIETLRKYKTLGLITPCKKKGKKDLYNKKDVIFAKNFIESSKNQGKSLQEIVGALRASREELDVAIKHINDEKTKHPRLSHSKYIFISGGIEYNPKTEIFFSKPINLTEFVKSVENLTGLKATASQSPT